MRTKSDDIRDEMVRVAGIHGMHSGAYKILKQRWFIEAQKEYSVLVANTTRAQRECLMDGDYKRKLKVLGVLCNGITEEN